MIRLNTVAYMGDCSVQSDTWVKPELIEVVDEPSRDLKAKGIGAVIEVAGRGTWYVQQSVEHIVKLLGPIPVPNNPLVVKTPNGIGIKMGVRSDSDVSEYFHPFVRIKRELKTLPKSPAIFLMRKNAGPVITLPDNMEQTQSHIRLQFELGSVVLFTNIEGVNPSLIDSLPDATFQQFMAVATPWLRTVRSLISAGGGQ